ncbi:dnaJ homolog subfamily C member 4 isoform X5 [Ailuropoda melanoleuca]|uniref:dnaJ homolog subfamily C member 4 isoform X5 n=1 Tax=Ailuropoda melanoleuca TaxID=9646 RepID=UPI001493E8D6|nr:dnaJ homolog subfamily C member 4 isoform X5 [Ailuropoda melanoleuca]
MHSSSWPPFKRRLSVAMLSLFLCRLWPRSPPTRLFSAATGQRSGPRNYYELLGVHPGASTEEVKRAFFSKSKEGHGKRAEESPAPPQLHPDRDPGNPALHSRFVELSEAYQVLSREHSRRGYDRQLCSSAPPKSPGATAHPGSAHAARRKLEQMHRSFMDEKDRIITAIYNDTRARARANRARLQENLQRRQLQPPPGDPGIPTPDTGTRP